MISSPRLKMMMNNTLEEKKENILTNELVKEDWMDEDKVDKMTDEQKVKYEDYKAKKKEFDENAGSRPL